MSAWFQSRRSTLPASFTTARQQGVAMMALAALVLIVSMGAARAFTPVTAMTIKTAQGETHRFAVEMALTPEQQARGLMHRSHMKEDAGMLFFFGGAEAPRSFWMKNTLIPLDMIFIRKDGTIHHIHAGAKPHDLTSVSSQGPVAAVLEINGGVAEKLGIRAGDRVHHAIFNN